MIYDIIFCHCLNYRHNLPIGLTFCGLSRPQDVELSIELDKSCYCILVQLLPKVLMTMMGH